MCIAEQPLHGHSRQRVEKINRIKELCDKPRLTWQQGFAYATPMRFFGVAALLLGCALCQAAPNDQAPDEMERMLEERGVIARLGSQLQQARSDMGERASDLVIRAMGFLGVPYRYGGNSETTGFDCSGLVRAVYEQSVGKILPRRADQQAAATEVIDRNDLKPGDLVFFNTMRRAFSHVGIYLGEGKFIHAPSTGGTVRVEDMRAAYWQARFNGARRVPVSPPDTASTP